MVYSDYYRVIMNITGSNNTKHYVEFAKAWLNDKDIDEGKMWYYYVYVWALKNITLMLFNQLNIGDKVYIIEVIGTFKKATEYNEGQVTQVSNIYEEPIPPGQFPIPNQQRKKLVDITIQCNGESKKFTIPENKSTITDNTLGLTISTNKQEIINIIRNQYNMYKQRKESIAKCDEEMAKCQQLLDKLDTHNETTNESLKIVELQNEINELKSIIRKANQMVPPPMKEMLPQDMKDVMNKVDQ